MPTYSFFRLDPAKHARDYELTTHTIVANSEIEALRAYRKEHKLRFKFKAGRYSFENSYLFIERYDRSHANLTRDDFPGLPIPPEPAPAPAPEPAPAPPAPPPEPAPATPKPPSIATVSAVPFKPPYRHPPKPPAKPRQEFVFILATLTPYGWPTAASPTPPRTIRLSAASPKAALHSLSRHTRMKWRSLSSDLFVSTTHQPPTYAALQDLPPTQPYWVEVVERYENGDLEFNDLTKHQVEAFSHESAANLLGEFRPTKQSNRFDNATHVALTYTEEPL